MAFPASANALGLVVDTTGGSHADTYNVPASGPYTHRLGTGLSPAQPSNWQNVPLGAFPIQPPAAPTLGTPNFYNSGAAFLNALGVYKYALSNVTDWGESIAGSVLTATLTSGMTAVNLTLPGVSEGTAAAPIRKRRLYRSADGQTALQFVAEIADLSLTSYVDGLADIYLGVAPPVTNGSGTIGMVTLSGSSVGTWTEVAAGSESTSGQYSVDYTASATGGTITHAAADAGVTGVTATYTAATLASANVVSAIITAIRDVADGTTGAIPLSQKAANSGVPSLNASGYVLQALAKGVRQVVVYQPGSDISTDSSHQSVPSTTYANWADLHDVAITTVAGSSVLAISIGNAWNYWTGGTTNWWRAALALDGANVQEGNYVTGSASAPGAYNTPSVCCGVWTGLSAGAHSVNVLGASGGPTINPAGGYKTPTSGTDSQLTVILVEFA